MQGCRDHTTGDHCESCVDGYVGDPRAGIQCKPEGGGDCYCNEMGSASQGCNPETGSCECKLNVEGVDCGQCKRDSYGLSSSNPEGCTKCWCSGLNSGCVKATMYWSTLRLPVQGNEEGWKLVSR